MKRIGPEIGYAIREMAGDSEEARVNLRVQQVRERYRRAIEAVYRDSAKLHLAHTNAVIISNKDGVKTLTVYVDDSLFAAELNAQRELIRLKLLELFGENVEDFQIRTSQWRKYREVHPYLDEMQQKPKKKPTDIPLDDAEKAHISNVSATVSDETIRTAFEKAMTADLQWKKGEKGGNS